MDYEMPVKSVGHGITTRQDLENPAQVWNIMLSLVQDIGHKLFVYKKKACGVQIDIRNSELIYKQWQTQFRSPTASPSFIAKEAFNLFNKNYSWEYLIRSLTVRAINLRSENEPEQVDFFGDILKLDRLSKLDEAIEGVRRRF